MALHIMPDPEEGHRQDEQCPCSPTAGVGEATVGAGRYLRPYRGLIVVHRPFTEAPTPAPDLDDTDTETTRRVDGRDGGAR